MYMLYSADCSERNGGVVAAIIVAPWLLVAVLLVVVFTVIVGTICWRRRKSKNRLGM